MEFDTEDQALVFLQINPLCSAVSEEPWQEAGVHGEGGGGDQDPPFL